MTLASLRTQFTSAGSTTIDEAINTQARFRQEERLRADLSRERRLRQQAVAERVNAMKANIAKDLAVQHELTLDALENELRTAMEAELETMERDALAHEEARIRHELDLRLERQVAALHEQHGVEQNKRLEERKAEMKASIETISTKSMSADWKFRRNVYALITTKNCNIDSETLNPILKTRWNNDSWKWKAWKSPGLKKGMKHFSPNVKNNFGEAFEPALNNNFVSVSSSVKLDSKWNTSAAVSVWKRTSHNNFNRTSNTNCAVKPTTLKIGCVRTSSWPSPSDGTSCVRKLRTNSTNNMSASR